MIEIRSVTSDEDLRECVRLQQVIWGFEEMELLPHRLFVVATKVGGQVFGGFDGSKMIAFLLAVPGLKPQGYSYLHSQMMGVLPEYRNAGVGRMLKLRQRDEALQRGLQLVEWTFDPLELKNAFFNIERLGAVIRRYVLNQYGTTTSHLHGGLPTDRCVAEWHLGSKRVRDVLNGVKPQYNIEARIEVPLDIGEIRESDPTCARTLQAKISEQFLDHFARDRAVLGFERGTYLLGPWQSD